MRKATEWTDEATTDATFAECVLHPSERFSRFLRKQQCSYSVQRIEANHPFSLFLLAQNLLDRYMTSNDLQATLFWRLLLAFSLSPASSLTSRRKAPHLAASSHASPNTEISNSIWSFCSFWLEIEIQKLKLHFDPLHHRGALMFMHCTLPKHVLYFLGPNFMRNERGRSSRPLNAMNLIVLRKTLKILEVDVWKLQESWTF